MSVTGKHVSFTLGGEGRIVNILEPVTEVWDKYRQLQAKDKEACGILIGSVDIEKDRIWIECATEPMSEDRRWRSRFKLQSNGHQQILNSLHGNSAGKLMYLGTWHSHPEDLPTPSGIDLSEWDKIVAKNDQQIPNVFAIVGRKENCIFIGKNGEYMKLEKRG